MRDEHDIALVCYGASAIDKLIIGPEIGINGHVFGDYSGNVLMLS